MQDHTSSSALENAIALQKFGVGQPVRRKEDDTLVRGKGKYTDDFNLPGQAYAWIVRSTHAHGTIRGIDTSAAKTMPAGGCCALRTPVQVFMLVLVLRWRAHWKKQLRRLAKSKRQRRPVSRRRR
jgi:CO/xanthine dehydrogenase Mo-binding subunit